jgi:hypothetical protein
LASRYDAFQEVVSKFTGDRAHAKREAQVINDWEAAIRAKLVEHINTVLPLPVRGKFLVTVRDADTPRKLMMALARVDEAAGEVHKKALLGDIRKLIDRVADSPTVDVKAKQAIREYIKDIEVNGHNKATDERIRATLESTIKTEAIGQEGSMPSSVMRELDILGRRPLKNMSEAEAFALIDRERETRIRPNVLLRLHGRGNKLRGAREKAEIMRKK